MSIVEFAEETVILTERKVVGVYSAAVGITSQLDRQWEGSD